MYVFVSYATENAPLAQRLNAALNAAGCDTCLGTKTPVPDQKYNERIKCTVDRADAFIFLANQHSVAPGSYALTELSYAEAKWRNPSGHVLPVITGDMDPGALPAYLHPASPLQVRGDLEASVVDWVQERAVTRDGGLPGLLSPAERLEQFARLSQPPLQRPGRRVSNSSADILMGGVLAVLLVGVFGLVDLMEMGMSPDYLIVVLPFFAAGVLLTIVGALKALIDLTRQVSLVAAIVVDKLPKDDTIILQTNKGTRLKLEPVTQTARDLYVGEIGWAYASRDSLLDFVPVSATHG